MRYLILEWSLLTFLVGMLIHIMVWRMCQPRKHLRMLLIVFILPVGLIFFLVDPWIERLAVLLLHTALSCAYIQIYPASQANSPSLRVLILVEKSMPVGLRAEEIQPHFSDVQLFDDRIQDLKDAGLIFQCEDALSLTGQGKVFIRPFIWIRKAMGLKPGKG